MPFHLVPIPPTCKSITYLIQSFSGKVTAQFIEHDFVSTAMQVSIIIQKLSLYLANDFVAGIKEVDNRKKRYAAHNLSVLRIMQAGSRRW